MEGSYPLDLLSFKRSRGGGTIGKFRLGSPGVTSLFVLGLEFGWQVILGVWSRALCYTVGIVSLGRPALAMS